MKISLETWIQSTVLNEEDGKCTLLSCNHVVGTSLDEVQTHKLGGTNPLNARELAEMFQGRARIHCQELEGTQLFRMLAFYEGRGEPQAKFHFRVQGETEFDGVVTEKADVKGFLGQSMRLFEANTSSTFRKDAMLFETMIRSNQIMADNNVKLTQQVMEAMTAMSNMMAANLQLQAEGRVEEIKLKAQFEERKMLIGMAPHMLNAAVGKEVMPVAASQESVFLELANTLTQEEFKMIMGTLGSRNPKLAAILSHQLSDALKNQREAKEEEMRTANLMNPEDDAGGIAH
jgi:hypothetical protein